MWPERDPQELERSISINPCFHLFFQIYFRIICIYLVNTIILFLILYLYIKEMSDKYLFLV